MNATIRRFAVSGSAAVAVLGGAATITLASPSPASATASEPVVERAVTAPVTLPDGRTIRITGMGGYGHQATAKQIAVVAGIKADAEPGSADGITNGLTPDSGSGAQLVNPQQVPAGTPQQYQTQASGGTIGVTVAVGVGLLIGVIVMVRRGSVKVVQAIACIALGVYLAPTFVGPLVQQLGGSIGTGLGNVWSGF
ncbi:hypothetical protein [Streptomyces lancefieldiae]|uniref:Secreted protein n=1 Tax=Streptomyces lancefieldiae TaxID=3075520 RepID=A0ABU3AF88_9ACTN|nr:hypothetical protein [Streptomyces sp. DSM 40712]MDT0608843.1 hypothetical protein [Streptomyces sp. DSM 40712]